MKERNDKKKKREVCIMLVGILLLAAAVLLTAFNIREDKEAGEAADHILKALFENQRMTKVKENKEDMLYSEREMPAIEFEENRYVGILEIPQLHLVLPIMEEWSNENSKIAPCCYRGSVYKDNLIIAGHNYKSHFGNLNNIPIGSEIKYTDTSGNTFHFSVSYVETISETDSEKMISGDWDLTLFTCTYSGRRRYVVRCIRQNYE